MFDKLDEILSIGKKEKKSFNAISAPAPKDFSSPSCLLSDAFLATHARHFIVHICVIKFSSTTLNENGSSRLFSPLPCQDSKIGIYQKMWRFMEVSCLPPTPTRSWSWMTKRNFLLRRAKSLRCSCRLTRMASSACWKGTMRSSWRARCSIMPFREIAISPKLVVISLCLAAHEKQNLDFNLKVFISELLVFISFLLPPPSLPLLFNFFFVFNFVLSDGIHNNERKKDYWIRKVRLRANRSDRSAPKKGRLGENNFAERFIRHVLSISSP